MSKNIIKNKSEATMNTNYTMKMLGAYDKSSIILGATTLIKSKTLNKQTKKMIQSLLERYER